MSLRSVRLVFFAIAALLLTPSAASAAWTVSPTPNVAGANDTSLNAVDCTSANSCMAVGGTIICNDAPFCTVNPTYSTVAEHWDGTSWKIVPTPDPFSSTPISLNGVSCPRPNVCFAVGSSESSSTPLIELWNGTSWSHQPSPAVPGGALRAVSCSRLLACTAIGDDATSSLAERWDGTGWQVQPIPNADPPRNRLFDVSCPLKRTCTAVGQSNGPFDPVPLAERWFGRVNSWGVQSAPEPEGALGAEFWGVSCPSGPVCFAVGDSSANETPVPGFPPVRDVTTLVERRVGSKWSVMRTPNPPGPSGRPSAHLFDVSCPGRRACHAVGDALVSTGRQIVIAERFDRASWKLETIPNPDSGSSPHLGDVSCPNRHFCMAVGDDSNTAGGAIFETLAAKWTP
jgi:hypothetical protein